MLNNFEKFVLRWIGRALEVVSISSTVVIILLDPIRGRLFEFDWLQLLAITLGIGISGFFVWFDGFLNTLGDIVGKVDK